MSTEARARNRRGEGSRLRHDIVAATAEILDESGDESAVTLRAVARRVGIAAPSIYPHFPDRQSILLAVVLEAFAELEADLRAAAAGGSGDDPVARLGAVCAAYLDAAGRRPHRYRLLFGGLWDSASALASGGITREQAEELGRGTLQLLAEGIEACVADGRSTSTDPRSDGVALWLGLHGLADQRVAAPTFPWPDDVVDRLVTSLARLTPSNTPTTDS